PRLQPGGQVRDRGGLVAGRLVLGDHLERCDGPLQVCHWAHRFYGTPWHRQRRSERSEPRTLAATTPQRRSERSEPRTLAATTPQQRSERSEPRTLAAPPPRPLPAMQHYLTMLVK